MKRAPEPHDRSLRLASFGIVAGGALWGLYWVPLRLIAASGLQGVWPGLAIYAALGLVLMPVAVLRLRRPLSGVRELAAAGLLVGAAFSFYSTSVILTDVARAILLFYLTPIWGTLLGIFVLGERLTGRRILAIVIALAGLLSVTGAGTGRAFGAGDALALASGVAWAFGSLKLHRMAPAPVTDLILAFVFGSLAVSLSTLALTGDALGQVPGPAAMAQALLPGVLVAAYLVPTLWLTIWPARLLSPGRTGLLLMSEVVVAVVTAALFAGEPFGPREALGAVLIVGASGVELFARPQSRSPAM